MTMWKNSARNRNGPTPDDIALVPPSKEEESETTNTGSTDAFAIGDSSSNGIASDQSKHEDKFSTSTLSDDFRSSHASSSDTTNKRSSYEYHKPSGRRANKLEGFTINQLNFDSAALYGRDVEVKQLRQTLMDASTKKQFVLLAGYSGTGKSALAKCLQEPVQKQNGLYVEGKFDIHNNNAGKNEPYSALATICGAICAHMLSLEQESSDRFHTIRNSIETSLGPELKVLLRVFPILEEVFGNGSRRDDIDETAQSPLDAKYRLNYAFCRFTRAISKFFQPLVVVIDDLQWADVPSLDLLEAVLMDHDAQMLVVGIYRSNEVDEAHLLTTYLQEWRAKDAFSMQEIAVENLNFDAVHQFVVHVLSMSDSQTLGLALLCQKRTCGNAYFLSQFLRLLHRDQLLQYNFGTYKWTWDEHEIENKTKATDNVIDLLLQNMQDLSDGQREILRIASCLGNSFAKETLTLLRNKLCQEEETRIDIEQDIEALVANGYLQESETSRFDFVHDKVSEAASLLTPKEEEKHAFQQRVGKILLVSLQPEDLEPAIFIVTNLLNEGELPCDDAKRLELAELNRRASAKAMTVSAFEAASNYASKGISLLGNAAFTKDYELALDLFSTGAEAESCLGNADKMEVYCKAVMEQTDRPINDKLRVYTTWLASLANRGHMQEAAKETLKLLEKFGIYFPRRKVMQTLGTLSKITKYKKAATKGDLFETLLALPIEKDPVRIKLLHLMDRLSVYLFLSQDGLMPLVMFRNFEWTLKYGMNDVTPAALTTLGIIYAGIMGDLQLGSEFAQTALKLIPRVSPLVEARTLFVAHGFGTVWTQPMHDQLKPLQRAYELGLCSGDAESACWVSLHPSVNVHFVRSSCACIRQHCSFYNFKGNPHVLPISALDQLLSGVGNCRC